MALSGQLVGSDLKGGKGPEGRRVDTGKKWRSGVGNQIQGLLVTGDLPPVLPLPLESAGNLSRC